ncbi:MAG: hypothetical protein A3J83_03535 [Elusimicrobia bacterium RIFOXYA2_FULL_40_6]|nr:MAG: hypothetical protein A3J83_03535 [Elusimicrobia bacterium RIFOXYA2_FULL_40_6]
MKKTGIYYSLTGLAVFLAILIFVNLIASYIFVRHDFSSGKIYSISKSSKKIVRELPDLLIIKAFFSKELSGEYAINKAYLNDLLAEYKTYSRGKIKYTFIDPAEKKETLAEAQQLGIMPVRFQQIARDKYEIKEGYMGIAFIFGDKKEIIPIVKSSEGLEYDITSKIKKLISNQIKTVGLVSGHGEETEMGELSEYLKSQYNVKIIDTSKEKEIPEDVTSLVITGPKNKFAEKEVFMLDQFLLKGKPIAFMIDQYNINTQAFWATKMDTGLDGFLQFYGIKFMPGFVLDTQCQKIALRSQQGFFVVQNIAEYPLYPMTSDIDKTNQIVKNMDSLAFPFISPIQIVPKDNLEIKTIIKSTKDSWFGENMEYLSPYTKFTRGKNDMKGPFNLAAAITPKSTGGTVFKSYFAGKTDKEMKKIADKKEYLKESHSIGRIFVISNSAFIREQGILFLNIIDWVSQDEDLISIRTKGASFRPLKKISDLSRVAFKYISILFVPVLVVGYGIFRWNRRRAMKKNIKNIYS